MKKTKKVDPKKAAKVELSARIAEALRESGLEVATNFEDFGFTEGTLVVSMKDTDVQVKFITPKSGLTRYEVETEDEDEDSAEESETTAE